jgi:S-DNA-T family DNA segregation ATPase FtsK/SpoIIIE
MLGVILVLFSVALLVAFISYFMHGYEDQSTLTALTDRNEKAQNLLGKFGAVLSDFFISRGFGVASFLFVKFFGLIHFEIHSY